jgi:hypothetical protein
MFIVRPHTSSLSSWIAARFSPIDDLGLRFTDALAGFSPGAAGLALVRMRAAAHAAPDRRKTEVG